MCVEKLTDNTASLRLSCPTLSPPLTLCSVKHHTTDIGSAGPEHPFGDGPLLSVLVYQ